jgi:HEAT repeat protein
MLVRGLDQTVLVGLVLLLVACSSPSPTPGRSPAPVQGNKATRARPAKVKPDPFTALRGRDRRIAELFRSAANKPSPAVSGDKPFPRDFPALSSAGFIGGNMSGMESEVTQLEISNRELLRRLGAYQARGAGRELERRMLAAKESPALKLLLASQAAVRGSDKALLFMLECMKSTTYHTVLNTHTAIGLALTAFEDHKDAAPAWAVEMAMAALSDHRQVTGLSKTTWASGTSFRVSYLADEQGQLTRALGLSRSPRVVPFLIALVKKTRGRRGPVVALGHTGDPRGVPALIECVERAAKQVTWSEGFGVGPAFMRPVQALGELKARAAVPVLLRQIGYPCVMKALRMIGDQRAVPALEALVKARGKVFAGRVEKDPGLARKRLAAARIALAALDRANRTSRLCALVGDTSLGAFDRREVVWELAKKPGPGAIPCLLKAARQDPSGAVVDNAIKVLSVFRHPAAVTGLIACFDADFKGKSNWKYAHTPKMFRQHVAESLQTLTGQKIGADKQRWLAWWKDEARGKLPARQSR